MKGLVGKKVATPFVSTSHYSLLAALKLAGVDPSKVKLVDLQPPDILAAWTRGDIDAAYVWSPTLDQLKKDGTVLTTSTEVSKAGYPDVRPRCGDQQAADHLSGCRVGVGQGAEPGRDRPPGGRPGSHRVDRGGAQPQQRPTWRARSRV